MSNNTGASMKDSIRTFNRYVLNPAMLHLAGRRHWYASVIRHAGRRSGKIYSTPVVAEKVSGDGFIVPLPYGTGTDWLRNVLASGQATITTGGRTFDVVDPHVIDAVSAAPKLAPRRRRTFERFGVDKFVTFDLADNR